MDAFLITFLGFGILDQCVVRCESFLGNTLVFTFSVCICKKIHHVHMRVHTLVHAGDILCNFYWCTIESILTASRKVEIYVDYFIKTFPQNTTSGQKLDMVPLNATK